jgi:hypothetical protein
VAAARCWWSRGRRKGEQQKGRARLGFIGMQDAMEVKGREISRASRHRSAGGAGVLDGVAWQPLGIDCPTWKSGGRPAEAAQAVGEVVARCMEQDQGGAEAAGQRTWPSRGGGVRQRRNRGEGERGRRRRTQMQF